MLFEWDESKRQANLAKHHIDFRDAKRVFDGLMEDIEIVVVYVMRGKQRRIISARRAHRNERQEYTSRLKSARQGQD